MTDWITTEEAVDLLGLSYSTLKRNRVTHRIVPTPSGRQALWSRSEVVRLRLRCRVPFEGPEPSPVDGARWVTLALRRDFALVDAGDYERVSQISWSVLVTRRTSYAMTESEGSPLHLHRFVMNAPDDMQVDHINGNGLDCRRSNLRLCSRTENARNYKKTISPTSSLFKGVSFHKRVGKWAATIGVGGKNLHLGYFATEVDAAHAYDRAAHKHFEDFAKTNFNAEGR